MREAIKFCKEWVRERKWLVQNGISPDRFHQETQFNQHVQELNLVKKAKK